MAEKVTNYQCPACTGPLHFSGASGRLECAYCGSSYSVEEVQALYAKKERDAAEAFEDKKGASAREDMSRENETYREAGTGWESDRPASSDSGSSFDADAQKDSLQGDAFSWNFSGGQSDWGSDGQRMRAYNCPSCGAELFCDESTAAGSCPYCGNPSIIPGQFAGTLKPDFILPFKLEKKAAVEALKAHYKGKFLLPHDFTAGNHIEEIKGVYVPFWMFDAKASGETTYEATRSITTREGDYEVTRTSHYLVKREGFASFEEIPTDASKQMPDDYMDSIEPFDYRELTEFSTAYMPGYLANKYDVSMEECAPRADFRCENSLADLLRRDVRGYHTVVEVKRDIRLKRGEVKYAFLPVWVLNTKWKNKNYLFMMNGQTGKLVGDLPVSKAKFAVLFLGLSVVLTLVFGFAGVGDFIASMFL